MRSPKCKYSATVTVFVPRETGMSDSITADTLEDLKHSVMLSAEGLPAHVCIKENRKTYPQFDWVTIEEHNINE